MPVATTIGFKTLNLAGTRVPNIYAEIQANGQGGNQQLNTLLIGGMMSAGTAAPSVPVLGTTVSDAKVAYGYGSQLAIMLDAYRKRDTDGVVWVCGVADDPSAAAATGTLTLTGPATGVGTLAAYISGRRVTAAVAIGDTATTMATNLAAAINYIADLPVTATAASGVVTCTAKNKGLVGNSLDLRMNYQGAVNGEVLPLGVGVAIVAMAGGTVNPSLSAALAAAGAGDTPFDIIVCAFSDTTSLNALDAFLDDSSGRWQPTNQLFGAYWTAYRGTYGAQTTFGMARNGKHGCCIGMFDFPNSPFFVAANVAGACAVSIRANPAVPLQDLETDILAPPQASRFGFPLRNPLLFDGIATLKTTDAGVVYTDRIITLYQKDPLGNPDDSWLDIETDYQLPAYVRDLKAYLAGQFSRRILVADGTPLLGGSAMVTAQVILASTVAHYRDQATTGLVQNPDQFAKLARAENAGGGVVALYLPVMLAQQLRVIGILVSFTKP